MISPRPRRAAHGGALVLVMILLAAMSIVSISIVTLASQGRIHAAAQSSHDALVECANAAQAQLWGAIAVNGKTYYTQPSTTMVVTSIRLPDGKELLAPGHSDSGDTSTPAEGVRLLAAGSPNGYFGDVDTTNTFAGGGDEALNGASWISARCRDASGRNHEVEFAFRFSI